MTVAVRLNIKYLRFIFYIITISIHYIGCRIYVHKISISIFDHFILFSIFEISKLNDYLRVYLQEKVSSVRIFVELFVAVASTFAACTILPENKRKYHNHS